MAQLPGQHDQLPAMVCFVGHEVTEKVNEISREVLPRRRRDCPTQIDAEPDHLDDAVATAPERAQQL